MKVVLAIILVIIAIALVVFAVILQPPMPPGIVSCPDGSTAASLGQCNCPNECCIETDGFKVKACPDGFDCKSNKCIESVEGNPPGGGGFGDLPDCPNQCCQANGIEFKEKACSTGFACVDNVCAEILLPDCPNECCKVGTGFKVKNCQQDYNCIGNVCVRIYTGKRPCPFECCVQNESLYLPKDCNSGQVCSAHKCYPGIGGGNNPPGDNPPGGDDSPGDGTGDTECPYICCPDGTGYIPKYCSGLLVCEDFACVKPDCPAEFQCCDGSVYKEKLCPAGKECKYGYCAQVTQCTDNVACIASAMYICARADSSPTILGERYTANILGNDTDPQFCKYYVRLDYSELRPGSVGKDMSCSIPYTAMSISEELIKSITRGQYPQYCSGSLVGN